MANPAWITSENIKFDGTLTNAVVLQTIDNIKTLIEWDTLSTEDKNILTDFVDTYGGTLPLVGPTPGSQTIQFSVNIGDETVTGLDNNLTDTNAIATIELGGNKLAGDESGLSIHSSRQYSSIIIVDHNKIKTVSFVGSVGYTIQDVIDEINVDLGDDATASLSNGNIIITSSSVGNHSAVEIYDVGFLFSSLLGYVGITNGVGVNSKVYTASITVDGTIKPISIVGNTSQTFGELITQLNTDLGDDAIASIVDGKLKVTSSTTGVNSKVNIVDGNLFKSLQVVKFFTPIDGIINLVDAMKKAPTFNNTSLFHHFNIKYVGIKPPTMFYTPHNLDFRYFDGTSWRYMDDNTTIAPPIGGGATKAWKVVELYNPKWQLATNAATWTNVDAMSILIGKEYDTLADIYLDMTRTAIIGNVASTDVLVDASENTTVTATWGIPTAVPSMTDEELQQYVTILNVPSIKEVVQLLDPSFRSIPNLTYDGSNPIVGLGQKLTFSFFVPPSTDITDVNAFNPSGSADLTNVPYSVIVAYML